jgi:hypothetical protein
VNQPGERLDGLHLLGHNRKRLGLFLKRAASDLMEGGGIVIGEYAGEDHRPVSYLLAHSIVGGAAWERTPKPSAEIIASREKVVRHVPASMLLRCRK